MDKTLQRCGSKCLLGLERTNLVFFSKWRNKRWTANCLERDDLRKRQGTIKRRRNYTSLALCTGVFPKIGKVMQQPQTPKNNIGTYTHEALNITPQRCGPKSKCPRRKHEAVYDSSAFLTRPHAAHRHHVDTPLPLSFSSMPISSAAAWLFKPQPQNKGPAHHDPPPSTKLGDDEPSSCSRTKKAKPLPTASKRKWPEPKPAKQMYQGFLSRATGKRICCVGLRCVEVLAAGGKRSETVILEQARMSKFQTECDRKAFVAERAPLVKRSDKQKGSMCAGGELVCNEAFKGLFGVSLDLIAAVKCTSGRRADSTIKRWVGDFLKNSRVQRRWPAYLPRHPVAPRVLVRQPCGQREYREKERGGTATVSLTVPW